MPPSPTPPAIGTASSSMRRHDGLERHARQLLQLALEAIEFAVRPAPRQQRRIVGAGHRAIVRIGIMPDGLDLDGDLVADLFIGADMGEGRVAAQHLAVARIHHAAADRLAELKPDLVESFEHQRVPGVFRLSIALSRNVSTDFRTERSCWNGRRGLDRLKPRKSRIEKFKLSSNAMIRQSCHALADHQLQSPGRPRSRAPSAPLRLRPWRRSEPARSSSGSAKRSGRGRPASSDGGLPDSPCSRC